MSNLTQAQRQVVEATERNLILRAGAGTGKTRVLVEHFLLLLERRLAEPTHIAAITYTEKAANELQVRLREATRRREQAAADPGERLYWRRCRLALEGARIGTFHSFCARLLREQSLRAGLDPGFTVLEEAPALLLRRQAVRETLREWIEQADETQLGELLGAFEFNRLEGLLGEMLRWPDICDRTAQRLLEQRPEEICRWWAEQRRLAERKVLQGLVSHPLWRQCLEELSRCQARQATDKAEENRRCILALAEGLLESDSPLEDLQAIWDACDQRPGSARNWASGELALVKGAMYRLREELVKGAREELQCLAPTANDERAVRGFRALGRLYLAAREHYRRLKEARGAVDFDDLLLRTRDLLLSDLEARGYYQRLIRYLLVDEFQDNAAVEREILFLLAEREPRASSWEEVELVPGKLFIVGDDKQSIYRFRGADVTVFNDTARRLASEGRADTLVESFRSTRPLIDFINTLFASVMGEEERPELFQSRHVPLRPHRGAGVEPPVELLVVPLGEKELIDEVREREARALASRLREITSEVPVVVDEETAQLRPARPSEVAVLLRAFSHVELYERALREAGLPYYLVGGSEYYQRPEVRDVVIALRTVLRPADEAALAAWLRSPMCGLTDEGLWLLAREGGLRRGLAEAERHLAGHPDRDRAVRAREVLSELRSRLPRLSLVDALETLFSITGYLATVQASFSAQQQRANLEQLLEVARGLEGSDGVSLGEFVDLMEELALRGPREEPAATVEEAGEAVRLMTIHQAKGLEFPVVCVADLGRSDRPAQRDVLVHRELGFAARLKTYGDQAGNGDDAGGDSLPWRLLRWQDGRESRAEAERLFYVAVTRARDYLILSGPWFGVSEKRFQGCWMWWVRRELPEDVEPPEPGREREVAFRDVTVRLRHGDAGGEAVHSRRRSAEGWRGLRSGLADLRAPVERVEEVRRRLAPVAVALGARESVPATAVAEFARCPRYYYLKHVAALPEEVLRAPGGEGRSGVLVGTAVHEVLRDFPRWSDGELGDRLKEVCEEVAPPGEAPHLREEAEALLEAWLKSPLARQVRRGRSWRTELPFACPLGEYLLEGRIDLIWETADGHLHLLDYKTDRVDEAGARRHGRYLRWQLLIYGLALERVLGRRPAKMSLYFLRPGLEVAVDAPADTEDLTRELITLLTQMTHGPYPERRGETCPCAFADWCPRTDSSGRGRC